MGKPWQNWWTKKVTIIVYNFHYHGRRIGPKLSVRKRKVLEEVLPLIELNYNNVDEYVAKNISKKTKIFLEIGLGSGENLLNIIDNTKINFIGCEPYLNGLASFLLQLEEKYYENVRVFRHDARNLLSRFPKKFLDVVIILFPDPWPKTRHKKRRIINKKNFELIINCLKKNGIIYTATDVEEYFFSMLDIFSKSHKISILNKNNYNSRPKMLSITRYEEKARKKDKKPFYLELKKILD